MTLADYVEAPELYRESEPNIYLRGWGDGNPFIHNNQYYYPSFAITPWLIGLDGKVNVSFLRGVGLTQGTIFKVEGVFPRLEIETYGHVFPRMMERLYSQIIKDVSVEIRITPGRPQYAVAP
jgi:hypothetical protein